MNRDYDTNRGVFTHNSFCGRLLSDEEIDEILFSCNISVGEYTNNRTSLSDIIDELLKRSRRAGSLSESRRIGDAILSLSHSLPMLEKAEISVGHAKVLLQLYQCLRKQRQQRPKIHWIHFLKHLKLYKGVYPHRKLYNVPLSYGI